MNTVTSKDGTQIVYDVSGNGTALIYITGATCFRKFMPVTGDVKTFSKAFTVYSYDRRGRGDSGNTLPYSIDREIEDIEALIDAAGGKVYLYGHSSGAVLALEAALRLGDKVQKVLIYDASYVHDEPERATYARLAQKVQALLDTGSNAKAVKVFLQEIGMPRAFVAMLPLFPGWKQIKALAPTLVYDIALTKDLPPLERIRNINIPVHVVFGAKSPAGLHDVARQLAGAIRGATYQKIDGQDHMVNAKILLPVLTKFFTK